MEPDLLNNLYLAGGLLAAMFVIVWRLTAASQKALQLQIDSLADRTELQIGSLAVQIGSLADKTELGSLADRTELQIGSLAVQIGSLADKTELGSLADRTELQIGSLAVQIGSLADRMESGFARLEDRLDKTDDRVRDLQMDMAVVKDRLNIPTDRPAPPVPARAGTHIPKAAAAEA